MKTLVIIPAYNEEGNILKTIELLKPFLSKEIDYIVINDGSTDNTLGLLKENKVNHINLISNLGIGGGVQTGYKYAARNDYDFAIQLDGDNQHDPKYLGDMIAKIKKTNSDIVIGSRFISAKNNFYSTLERRIGIKIISFLIKIKTGVKIKDTTSGFRIVNKKVIDEFAENYPVDYPEPITNAFLANNNFKLIEMPVEMRARDGGSSSINLRKGVFMMLKVMYGIIFMRKGRHEL